MSPLGAFETRRQTLRMLVDHSQRRFDPQQSSSIAADWLVPNWQYDIVPTASLSSEVVRP
jgi:hypothetical protein